MIDDDNEYDDDDSKFLAISSNLFSKRSFEGII
jgi:hypothetical protein